MSRVSSSTLGGLPGLYWGAIEAASYAAAASAAACHDCSSRQWVLGLQPCAVLASQALQHY